MNILPLIYLGNIQYFTKLCFSECIIDTAEHYVRRSYRNRCEVMSANGPISLTVPIINDGKIAVRHTRIDNSKRWQHQHWHAIVSAYRNSPYFEYYYDSFEPFYSSKYELLADFNKEIIHMVLKLLGVDVRPLISETYIYPTQADAENDYRGSISPRPSHATADPQFRPEPYWQVFSEKHPFMPNLSIIDLLFCEGPHSMTILERSLKI